MLQPPISTPSPANSCPAAAPAASPAKSSSSSPASPEGGSRRRCKDPRYKTVLCKNFVAAGKCPYGKKCQFAHGQNELRERPPVPSSPVARDTAATPPPPASPPARASVPTTPTSSPPTTPTTVQVDSEGQPIRKAPKPLFLPAFDSRFKGGE